MNLFKQSGPTKAMARLRATASAGRKERALRKKGLPVSGGTMKVLFIMNLCQMAI
jgi:hypothetical protein